MYGKPVIGVRTKAVATVVDHGRDGFLIRPRGASELAECIIHWFDNPDLKDRMGSRGQEKVKCRYTIPHIADIVEGVYHRVLRKRKRSLSSNEG
jgi:glycosyltransferase involved in cell wall biosynthesis